MARLRQKESFQCGLLASFLRLCQQQNPTSNVAMQEDNQHRFYRMFVTIPHASCIFQKFCIPKLHIDGCFSKTPQYDGVIIAVVATAFNGQNLILAAAWVPSENVDNLVWVV